MDPAQPNEPDLDALLRHQDWVRALARSLVADPAAADDVAQETLLATITRPPADARRPRAWLAQVAHNAARALGRRDRRRVRRERAVARPDVDDADPAAIAHRAALHKRIVDAVFELPEPYHTVVVLRYFDDLDAAQVAARLGRPVATVRTQLQRGLARLRDRLDREFGERRTWHAALVPLLAPRRALILARATGAATLWVLAKWVASATALLATLWLAREHFATAGAPARPGGAAADAPTRADARPGVLASEREAAIAPGATTAIETPAAAGAGTTATAAPARGRVVTIDGSPIAGLTLAVHDPQQPRLLGRVLVQGNATLDLDQPDLRDLLSTDDGIRAFAASCGPHAAAVEALLRGRPIDRPRATTDGGGRFVFDGVAATDEVTFELERSDLGIYGAGWLVDEPDPVLVVGPVVPIAGRVVDGDGNGLADATVSLGYTVGSLPGFPQHFDHTQGHRSSSTSTAADGAFDLGAVPALASLEVTASKNGYADVSERPTEVQGPVLWILHALPPDDGLLVTGTVRYANGSPAAQARVVFDRHRTSTDAAGRFELPAVFGDCSLTAWLPGLQPAIVAGLGSGLLQEPASGRDLELVLGGPTRSISGQVLDAQGQPRAGVRVLLGDGTTYGTVLGWLESEIGGQSDHGEITNDDGRFTLRGLSARNYQVRAIDESSLLVLESGPVAAGTADLVLAAPPDAFVPLVEGQLVDRFGAPVAGASVGPRTHGLRSRFTTWLLSRPDGAVSDAQGRFELRDCPRRNIVLAIEGRYVEEQDVPVPGDEAPARILVARRFLFRIRSAGTSGADAFAIVDADGQRLELRAKTPNRTSGVLTHDLPSGASPLFSVTDRAIELVLLAGEREVQRIPLRLVPDQINDLDL